MKDAYRRLRLFALPALLLAFSMTATAAPTITESVFHQPAHGQVGEALLLLADGLVDPVQVFFSDGNSPSVPAVQVHADTGRGAIFVKIPAGAQTGYMKITADGVDSPPYYFRVDPGVLDLTRTVVGRAVNGGGVSGALAMLLNRSDCDQPAFQDFAVVDPNGDFLLHANEGDYLVLVFAPLGSGLATSSLPITVTPYGGAAPIIFLAGTITTGRVVDAITTEPVPSARVSFAYLETTASWEEIVTDPNGEFQVALLPGQWLYGIRPPLGDPHSSGKGTTSVSGPSQSLGDLTLATGVRITGFVTREADGTPLAGAEIEALGTVPCCPSADWKSAAGDGSYALVVPPSATYDLHARFDDGSGVVDVLVQDYVVGGGDQSRDIAAPEAAIIRGTVTEHPSGASIGGIRVEGLLAVSPFSVHEARTCDDGTYRLRVLPGGDGYVVGTREDEGGGYDHAVQTWNGAAGGTYFQCEGTAVPAPAAGATTTGIDFNLPQAAALEGQISTEAGGCGDDVAGAAASIMVDDGADHACSLGTIDAAYGPPGYRIAGLPPSSVVPSMRACIGLTPYDPQCHSGRTPPAFDPIVLPPRNTQPGVDFCLAPCSPRTWYRDADGDGHGDPFVTAVDCNMPPGHVADGDDCDDSKDSVHPGAQEACNDIDDDCDGTTDGFATSCGVGACASTGTCTGGVDSCTPGPPGTETCNDIDDDCDGTADDGDPGGGAPCDTGQPGACAAGETSCVSGSLQCIQTVQPTAEICNGVDDDCDGTVDDGDPGGGAPCDTGLPGICAPGTTRCQGGSLDCLQTVQPSTETCNNVDEDCDGFVDGFATTCGVGACVSAGVCTAGVDSCAPGAPSPEACNGVDDDCDGKVDGFATTCGVGACVSAGTCEAGVDSCVPGPPSAETCDGVDNDCDRATDEGWPDADADAVCDLIDNCVSVYNPSQDDSDGDAEGGDACDISVTFPLEGEITCNDPPPTIRWSREVYDRFRVLMSWRPDFPSRKRVTSGKRLLKTDFWEVSPRKWRRVCRKADPILYIAVMGKTRTAGMREFSEVVSITVK